MSAVFAIGLRAGASFQEKTASTVLEKTVSTALQKLRQLRCK